MLIRTVVAVALALGLCACSSTKADAPAAPVAAAAAPVKIALAETRTVPVDVTTVGNVEALTTIQVRSQVTGALMKVHFQEGQMVRQGDSLFEIDTRPFDEAIRRLEANLARDVAVLHQAEASLAGAQAQDAHFSRLAERYKKLAEQGIFSIEQAEQAELEVRSRRTSVRVNTAAIESAHAAIKADEAAIANAKLDLSYCYVKSPITGRTGAIKVKAGNIVKANDMDLVTILQVAPAYVTFSVPEEHLAAIRQKAAGGKLPVRASIPGDSREPVQGTLSFLDNAVDNSTGTIRLKGTFANGDGRLWPGQFVDVKLRLEDKPAAVVVPSAALQTGQQGNYVWVVKQDGSVELRVVTPGPRIESSVAIDKGLGAGETVVIEGQVRLVPGAKVKVLS